MNELKDDRYCSVLLRHRKLIWWLCSRYARKDVDRCRDLVQEVTLALWEHYGSLQDDATPLEEASWVTQYAHAVLRKQHRLYSHEPATWALRDGVMTVDELADTLADNRDDVVSKVDDMLADLSDEDRCLMQMRRDGFDIKEIGRVMGLQPNAVYQRIYRITIQLKQQKQLKQQCNGEKE